MMGAFREAGMYTKVVPNMETWLKAHAAFDIPMVAGAYAVGGDVSRLARTPEALVLIARAIQENFRVLRTLGIPVTPVTVRMIGWLPEFLLVAFLGRLFRSEFAELGIGKHADDSPDEMKQLDSELQELAHVAGVPTPATDQLRAYLDPNAPRIPEGRARTTTETSERFIRR
jgi:2-dehydropantoate 2-reductase